MKFKECFISWYWSHTLLIIFCRIYSPSNFRFSKKKNKKKIKFVPITIILLSRINLEHLELLRPWEASDPAPWRPQVYMKLTLTHIVTMMQLAYLLDGRSVLNKLLIQNEV